ncbi:MAG: cyclic nucleotide-binding domain-containing protein [Anaerolineales bacterium]
MNTKSLLRNTELFAGLTDEELDQVVRICQKRTYQQGEVITSQGAPGDALYLVLDGFAEVILVTPGDAADQVIVHLGSGQVIGEMALIDKGPRSATVRANTTPTVIEVITQDDFERLCEENTRIGYLVMRNLAADLSFKLRHKNLTSQDGM